MEEVSGTLEPIEDGQSDIVQRAEQEQGAASAVLADGRRERTSGHADCVYQENKELDVIGALSRPIAESVAVAQEVLALQSR